MLKIEDKIYGDELIVRGPDYCFNDILKKFPSGFFEYTPVYGCYVIFNKRPDDIKQAVWSPARPNQLAIIVDDSKEIIASELQYIAITDEIANELLERESELKYPMPWLLKIEDGVEYYVKRGHLTYPFTYNLGDDFITINRGYPIDPYRQELVPEEKEKILKCRELFYKYWKSILCEDGTFLIFHGEGYKIGYRVDEWGRYYNFILCVGQDRIYNDYESFPEVMQRFDFYEFRDKMQKGRYNEISKSYADDNFHVYRSAIESGNKYFIYSLKFMAGKATQEEADYCNNLDDYTRFVPEDKIYTLEDITIHKVWEQRKYSAKIRRYSCQLRIGKLFMSVEWITPTKTNFLQIDSNPDKFIRISEEVVELLEGFAVELDRKNKR